MALADRTIALAGSGYPRFVPDHHGGASLTLAMIGMAKSSSGWPGPDWLWLAFAGPNWSLVMAVTLSGPGLGSG